MSLISKLKKRVPKYKTESNKWLKEWLHKKAQSEIQDIVKENAKRLKIEKEEWTRKVLSGDTQAAFKELKQSIYVPVIERPYGKVKSIGVKNTQLKTLPRKAVNRPRSKYLSTFTPRIESVQNRLQNRLQNEGSKFVSKYDPSQKIEITPDQLDHFKRDIAWSLPPHVIEAFKTYIVKAEEYYNNHPEIHSYFEDFEEWYSYIIMY